MGPPVSFAELTLAVLVGGRGTRLGGRAKGNLRLAGRTLLDAQLAAAPGVAEVLLVGDDGGAHAALGARRVADLVGGRGALAGLASALAAARTDWVLVTACDMPGLTPEAIAALLAGAGASDDAACFLDAEGALHPFPGLYRARLGAPLRASLSTGDSVRAVLERLRLARLPVPAPAQGRDAVSNVNTWDDARRLGVDDAG